MIRAEAKHKAEQSMGLTRTKQMSKPIEINQSHLKLYTSKMPPAAAQAFISAVQTANEIVNEVESRPATTQDYYGDYLSMCESMTEIAVFLCAGANKQGLASVVKINQWGS